MYFLSSIFSYDKVNKNKKLYDVETNLFLELKNKNKNNITRRTTIKKKEWYLIVHDIETNLFLCSFTNKNYCIQPGNRY